ncbi:MAG: ImmA/IrrE family metallo-endopeptidase [Candidatus Omnitrophica bacterium]|nr:ImmA/IrrE family metallo-endopeptidase [Candidatus Omnitrophota bacterium]
MELQSFKAPFITPEEAWNEADRVRSISWPSGKVPIDIEEILGHFILHKDIYKSINHASIKEWIEFVQFMPEDQYAYIEQHAYEFAGRLLVPTDRLKQELYQAYRKAKEAGFMDWEKSGDAAREYIASSICRVFGVSSAVIEKRIIREQHKLE